MTEIQDTPGMGCCFIFYPVIIILYLSGITGASRFNQKIYTSLSGSRTEGEEAVS